MIQSFYNNGPLIALAVLYALSFVVSCVLHGKAQEGKHNLGVSLLALAIIQVLLVFGGFYSVIRWNQIIMIVLAAASFIVSVAQDGKEKKGYNNCLIDITGLSIHVFLILVWYVPLVC